MTGFLPFWDHVDELRKTLIQIGLTILIGVFLSFFFYKPLFSVLVKPIEKKYIDDFERVLMQKEEIRAHHHKMTYTLKKNEKAVFPLEPGVIEINHRSFSIIPGSSLLVESTSQGLFLLHPLEGFLTALKLSCISGIVLSSPIWLFFLIRFFLPALLPNERTLFFAFLVLSFLFLGLGACFGYFCSLPVITAFFNRFNSQIGTNLWALGKSFDFVLWILCAHAIAFELFVAALLLVRAGFLTFERLRSMRRYIIVAIFIVSAILTPPDVLSQLLLAGVLWMLYEGLLIYSYFSIKYQSH